VIDLTLIPDGGVGWLDASGPSSHLVLSTRVRLARNLAGHPYATRNGDVERETVLSLVEAAAAETATLGRPVRFRLDRLDRTDRQLLHERHLVSKELAGLEGETGVRSAATLLLQDTIGAMVNEEDHLRLQGFRSGFDLAAAYESVDRLDTELGQRLPFAFHSDFGYLTACPTNVGTGLRASVLIHLPGLVLTKEISKVLQGLAQVGLTYRGLYGEGSEVVGNFFQLSNQTTLGKSEQELLDHLAKMVRQVMRALSFDEAMNLLSGVRLGVGMEIIPGIGMYTLNKLLIYAQPAHLAQLEGVPVADPELPVRRANYVRRVLEAEVGRRGRAPGKGQGDE
jgi:protein arginine kinase